MAVGGIGSGLLRWLAVTSPGELFAGYPAVRGDEAVGPTGVLVGGYAVVGPELERLGASGLTAET